MSREILIRFWGNIRMNLFVYFLLNSITFIFFNITISILVSLINSKVSSISWVVLLTGHRETKFALLGT